MNDPCDMIFHIRTRTSTRTKRCEFADGWLIDSGVMYCYYYCYYYYYYYYYYFRRTTLLSEEIALTAGFAVAPGLGVIVCDCDDEDMTRLPKDLD